MSTDGAPINRSSHMREVVVAEFVAFVRYRRA